MSGKQLILPSILLIFIILVFLDQNSHPVTMKMILGSPIHISLSALILGSMLLGVCLGLIGAFVFSKMKGKLKKKDG